MVIIMVQTTVRFYEESIDDKKALKALSEHRSYGFDSSRKMIIAAITSYANKGIDYDDAAEMLAEKLVDKLKKEM